MSKSLAITSYELDRRGNVMNQSAVDHTTVSEAIAFKREKGGDFITFVQVGQESVAAVRQFLNKETFDLYPTKREDRYVMGYAKGSSRPSVPCELK